MRIRIFVFLVLVSSSWQVFAQEEYYDYGIPQEHLDRILGVYEEIDDMQYAKFIEGNFSWGKGLLRLNWSYIIDWRYNREHKEFRIDFNQAGGPLWITKIEVLENCYALHIEVEWSDRHSKYYDGKYDEYFDAGILYLYYETSYIVRVVGQKGTAMENYGQSDNGRTLYRISGPDVYDARPKNL